VSIVFQIGRRRESRRKYWLNSEERVEDRVEGIFLIPKQK
jgi:hypothetical protein